MDKSPDATPQKTSPLIIKLCCPSSSKEPDVSPSEPVKDPLTSPSMKPVALKMKPVALTFCRLSKDGTISKSPEPLKISPALSLQLGAALRERIPLKCLPNHKLTIDTKSNEADIQRQSLTSHSSKLSDNRLDFVHGGDKSNVLQLPQPPLTMQPSNLHTDDLLDAKYGGGGLETSVVQGSSTTLSPVANNSVRSTKCTKKQLAEKETEIEPAAKKIKLHDTIEGMSESQSLSSTGVTIANISTKKSDFRNPLGKQICVRPSMCMLENEKNTMVITPSQPMFPSASITSSVEKVEDVGVKLESPKRIQDKKPVVVTTEYPHFVIACSSNNSEYDGKIESVGNFKTSSLEKTNSDVNPQFIKPEPFSPTVVKSEVSDDDKTKAIKTVSVFNINQGNKTDVSQSNVNLKSGKYSPLTLTNVISNNEHLTNIEVNDIFVSQMETHEIDQHLKSEIENVQSEKESYFNSEISKAKSFSSNQIDGINIVKNDLPKMEEENITIDSTDQDKKDGLFCKQGKKVCPFKLSFEGRLNAEYDKQKKVTLKSEILEKDLIPLQIKKDNCNETNLNSNDFLAQCNNPTTKSNDSSEIVLEESPKNNSLSESFVNISGDIANKELNFKETEVEMHDEDNSCNELVGILSDESNQVDSQNCNKEPEIEFDILDEFESNDNDPEQEARSSGSESEISADEIDAMLEAGLGDYGKPNAENQHEVKEKLILKVRGKDHFEVLPEGWIEVTHNSGIPIYLHKQTRVCCVSKPYFLGPGSTRKHEIPISAIPCLHYMKELEKERLEAENKLNGIENKNSSTNNTDLTNSNEPNQNGTDNNKTANTVTESGCAGTEKVNASEIKSNATEKSTSDVSKGSNLIFPSAKLESVKEVKVSGSLDYLAVREYCQKRFEFQTITVKRFKTWFGRRKHQKQVKRKQRPFLPDNTQLITCPLPANTDKSTTIGSTSKREFIMNPTGKSPVCILHEYVQHTLRVQPKYIFKELESASTPYGAVVIINEMEYGTGYGSSKKVAKSEAARSALEVLIPKIKKMDPEKRNGDDDDFQDVEFFDQIRVEDPRISDLSVKAGQPFPYQILLECLKRNYGMGDTEISIRMKNLKHQKNEFIMKVGKHKATVVCKNKRDGKHRASQAILQQLHPHIVSWGSLLRMYGKGSCKTLKEKKEEEQRITELQSKACVNRPNVSILNKLKEEMTKYREKMKSKKPIGKLIPERMQLFSISDSNLKSIEL